MRILCVNPRIWVIVYCFTSLFENKFLFIWTLWILKFLLICALSDILRIVFRRIKRWSIDEEIKVLSFFLNWKTNENWRKIRYYAESITHFQHFIELLCFYYIYWSYWWQKLNFLKQVHLNAKKINLKKTLAVVGILLTYQFFKYLFNNIKTKI